METPDKKKIGFFFALEKINLSIITITLSKYNRIVLL